MLTSAWFQEWAVYTCQDQSMPKKKRRRNTTMTAMEQNVHDRRLETIMSQGARPQGNAAFRLQADANMASLLWACAQNGTG